MKMDLPAPVVHSLFALNEARYEAYVVGGCVRDSIMGSQPSDWDVTTSALPEQMQEVFADYRTINTGLKHGTLTVIIDEQSLEITTYRVDGTYSDGRHPDEVTFTRSLAEDLRRRDFTINAMAYHPQEGLVDLFEGYTDIQNGTIRCVGEPEVRFTEDALRILRCLRFSSTLGFTINPATSSAIHRLSPTLARVSAERITTELTKLVCGKNAGSILKEYADVFTGIIPAQIDYDSVAMRFSDIPPLPLYRYGLLFFGLSADDLPAVTKQLRFSRRLSEDLHKLIRFKHFELVDSNPKILRLLHHLGPKLASLLVTLRSVWENANYSAIQLRIQTLIKNKACYTIDDLAINGTDLLANGLPPGPKIGEVLYTLLEAVMDERCPNNREQLLRFLTDNKESLC